LLFKRGPQICCGPVRAHSLNARESRPNCAPATGQHVNSTGTISSHRRRRESPSNTVLRHTTIMRTTDGTPRYTTTTRRRSQGRHRSIDQATIINIQTFKIYPIQLFECVLAPTLLVLISGLSISSRPSNPLNVFLSLPSCASDSAFSDHRARLLPHAVNCIRFCFGAVCDSFVCV